MKTLQWRNLEFDVSNADVYPPKPASLLLADIAMQEVQTQQRILDTCTGSGVVGIAAAKAAPESEITLADSSTVALEAARANASRNGVNVQTVISDLYNAFDDEYFDMITVHPPAVPYPEGKDWGMSDGMRLATHGGHDGSRLVVRSIEEAARCLKPEGKLLLLLPHWSSITKAWKALRQRYNEVVQLASQQVVFFPAIEGRHDEEMLRHVGRLAEQGSIQLRWEEKIPTSEVSVIRASRPRSD